MEQVDVEEVPLTPLNGLCDDQNVGLFQNKEQRKKNRDQREKVKAQEASAKEEVRRKALAQIDAHLTAAVAAACDGDILAEEEALSKAALIAQNYRPTDNSYRAQQERADVLREWEQKVVRHEGLIRRGQWFGFVGPIHIWSDRIVVSDEAQGGPPLSSDSIMLTRLLDADTHAEVMTEGEIRESKRPTLTRMAFGSVLPGTALIPGLALQKTQTSDSRRIFFTIEQSGWGRIIELDPSQADFGEVTQIAMNINAASARIKASEASADRPDSDVGTDSKSLAMEHLKKLDELRDAGVITESEFAEKKQKLLDEI